jgi:hypothetical protein
MLLVVCVGGWGGAEWEVILTEVGTGCGQGLGGARTADGLRSLEGRAQPRRPLLLYRRQVGPFAAALPLPSMDLIGPGDGDEASCLGLS